MTKGDRNKQARARQAVLALLTELVPAAHRGQGVATNVLLLAALTAASANFAATVSGNVTRIAKRKTLANARASLHNVVMVTSSEV